MKVIAVLLGLILLIPPAMNYDVFAIHAGICSELKQDFAIERYKEGEKLLVSATSHLDKNDPSYKNSIKTISTSVYKETIDSVINAKKDLADCHIDYKQIVPVNEMVEDLISFREQTKPEIESCDPKWKQYFQEEYVELVAEFNDDVRWSGFSIDSYYDDLVDIGKVAKCLTVNGVNPDDLAVFTERAKQRIMEDYDTVADIAPELVQYATVPEFGHIALVVLMSGIVGTVIITRRFLVLK